MSETELQIEADDSDLIVTEPEASTPVATVSIVSLARLMSASAGQQVITGVGFRPRAVMVLSGLLGGGTMGSVGVATASASGNYVNQDGLSIAGSALAVVGSAAAYSLAALASLDADGFTIDWTKVGSPTGTAQLTALCFR